MLGLLLLFVALIATLASLVATTQSAIRRLALAVVLVILWAALPALGLKP